MQKNKILNGTVKRHPDGFGFFIPDDKEHPDVYIPRQYMEGIMTNDKVAVTVTPERGTDRFRGEIVKVLSRGTKTIVGRFFRLNDNYGIIRDEGKGWGTDLRIKLEDSMEAKDKELVAAEITVYPEEGKKFAGKVVEVIGDALDPLTDIKRVILGNNIPQEFSKAALEEAKSIPDVPEEKDFKNRKDLRGLNLITIDGATAKDFDDAVYVEMTDEGFRLFVAIADVSHYVQVGSAIDRDAYERGTSVYFPNFVVPMLPEVLSNGLCSLNPHVPRLCLVAEMLFDFTGELMKSEFYEGVMESKARVTYGEAQEVIDGFENKKLDHVKEGILRLADLAKILMAKRFREGSVDLEIPETELVIDGAGVPIDIQRSERLFSHRLIEEMMLAANVAVAKFLSSKEIGALYRIHEPPNEQAIHMLENYMQNFGGKTKLDGGKLQKRLTKALEEFKGRPEAQVLHILTLRSMSQAKYSKNNLGHFGLGFEFYTHFTSPIRRYPDLIVHRLLKSQVMHASKYRLMSEDDLASAGTVLSAAEQRSTKAERQVQAIKKARFMQKFVGQEFDGMISSVAKFGVFVLLREYDIDGLIRLDDLGKERFEFDEEKLSLIAPRSGFSYTIGDRIRVQVAAADPELGQINFVLVGAEKRADTPYGDERAARDEKRGTGRHEKRPDKRDKFEKKPSRPERPQPGAHAKSERGGEKKSFIKKSSEDRNAKKSDFKKEDRPTHPGQKSRFFRDSRDESAGQEDKQRKAQNSANLRPQQEGRKGMDEGLMKMILGPSAAGKAASSAPVSERSNPVREDDNDNTPQTRVPRTIPVRSSGFGAGKSAKDKPQLSKKLMFAERSKLQDNDENSEKNGDSLKNGKPDRKDAAKRGKTQDNRGGLRKTRVSPGRGKGKTR